MRAARASKGGTWVAIAAPLACAVVVACSSSASPPATHAAAQAVCPATPEDTIGVACSVSGLTCGPEYTCGVSTVALFCVCTAGAFQCVDGTGAPVAQGDVLACPDASATQICPASERTAELAACTEQGLLCTYASSCPSMFDQCQCTAGTTASGAFGLRFDCNPSTCPDGGPPVDGAAPVDGGVPTDAAPPVDAGASTPDSGAAGGLDGGSDAAPPPDAGTTPAPDAMSDAATADALTE
ncbi:MAG TPA: hypothetical protein VGM06_08350 [Polyangiaceae bacterium]